MRRTDLLDTSPWAHREMIRRAQAMTPEQRLQRAFEMSEESRRMFPEQTKRYFEALIKERQHDLDP